MVALALSLPKPVGWVFAYVCVVAIPSVLALSAAPILCPRLSSTDWMEGIEVWPIGVKAELDEGLKATLYEGLFPARMNVPVEHG